MHTSDVPEKHSVLYRIWSSLDFHRWGTKGLAHDNRTYEREGAKERSLYFLATALITGPATP